MPQKRVMNAAELPPAQWKAFLEQLGRDHRAWLASVEQAGSMQARDQPLESISVADEVEIRIGGKVLRVSGAKAVRVERTVDGAISAFQIDDSSGRRLTLRFRIAVAAGALDGIAPAER
jgi:hypothetical protein